MKKLIGAVLLICAFATNSFAVVSGTEPGTVNTGTGTAIRTTAIVTTSDVLSTTFTVAESKRAKAIHYYIAATIGSATNLTFTPAGAMSTAVTLGPASTGYYGTPDAAITVTASGNYHIRVPIAYDGATTWHGILSKGTGTMTSSDALISYKLEY